MRRARILLLTLLFVLSGCGAAQGAQDAAAGGVADVQQAADDAGSWMQSQIPWNKRVQLLEFGTAPDATLDLALRALDQVNPLETAPKLLASLRAPFGMEPDRELVECDNSGHLTGKLDEKGVTYWDFKLSRLRVDMVNYSCYSTFWMADVDAGRGKLDVTLRALAPAVTGYAHYMSNPGGLSSEQRDISCIAGLLLWQLTQPFTLVQQEPPYLSVAQARVVLGYVKLWKSQIGNRAEEGFVRHDPGGCQA